MMAKFQQKKEESGSSLEKESELEKILPPSALPTLTTLSEKNDGIDLSAISSAPATAEEREKAETVGQMGAGVSPAEEVKLLTFLREVVEELKYIEWPRFGRVVRLSVLILVTVIVAAFALYFIDGFFYRMSQLLFEGAAV